jgi:error-prone DNA polymerase
VQRAHELGYAGLAITDECSMAGVVRAHVEARRLGLSLLIGTRLTVTVSHDAGPCVLVLLARNRQGYGDLCQLITRARARAAKGQYRVEFADLRGDTPGLPHLAGMPHCEIIWLANSRQTDEQWRAQLESLQPLFDGRLWLGARQHLQADEHDLTARLIRLSVQQRLPVVAVGDVQMDRAASKPLHDLLTALRHGRRLADCTGLIEPNAEACLRPRARLAQRFPAEWLAASISVAARCDFNLDSLRYEYPEELVPQGYTPDSWLAELVQQGLAQRYPQGVPTSVHTQIEHELALIAELRYAPYFLTVADIVAWARAQGILCQGRGSAANSAVCYALHITEVDPARSSLLFERFISRERREPPDIDVDFEHQRRDEVIAHIYTRYGRHRAALAASVISYRPRSALRDAGRALDIPAGLIEQLARDQQWWDGYRIREHLLEGSGLDTVQAQRWMRMTQALLGLPRHLSQHVGGFVIARDDLSRLVPIEPAAMAGRSVIQWDKDDLESLGLLKIDILALGMLSALQKALAHIGRWRGLPAPMRLQDISPEDPATYRMISTADTMGVFQIESRAQMSMLPRLRPRTFYDLVIEVALVRPGPIQGGMVHPYLRRRQGLEPVSYPSPAFEQALGRTLGVPIFQEQVMQVAMAAAGFSAGEADNLRRAMAAWRRKGGVQHFHERIVQGMVERGYDAAFAEQIFRQIEGFGEYGFPESHAASFALLVYASSWIKCHEPACFLAGLLDAQPLGFYSPAQLVADARRHGVQVLPLDLMKSQWHCTLEPVTPQQLSAGRAGQAHTPRPGLPTGRPGQPAVRLGWQSLRGLGFEASQRIVQARQQGPFRDVGDLARRCQLSRQALQAMAQSGVLDTLAGHRRNALWQASGSDTRAPELIASALDDIPAQLEAPSLGERVLADHRATGLSLEAHPLALLRPALAKRGALTREQLMRLNDGRRVRTCGLVTHRQRPQTAGGTLFLSLEDETGLINLIVQGRDVERWREAVLKARLLWVEGIWQRQGAVCNLLGRRYHDGSRWLGELPMFSRDFR